MCWLNCDNGQHTTHGKNNGKKRERNEEKKCEQVYAFMCVQCTVCIATTKESKYSMYNASGLADVDVYNNCLFYLRISTQNFVLLRTVFEDEAKKEKRRIYEKMFQDV